MSAPAGPSSSPDDVRGRRPTGQRALGGISLGRPLGIPVTISPAFLLLGGVVALFFEPVVAASLTRPTTTAAYTATAIVAVGVLASVVLHEYAHAVVARGLGLSVRGVMLFGLGGATMFDAQPDTPAREYLITMAGPLVNVLLGGLTAAAGLLTDRGDVASVSLRYLAALNAGLAAFNLLPGLPLDGGKLLGDGVWRLTGDRARGVQASAYGGIVVAGLVAAAGVGELAEGSDASIYTLLLVAFMLPPALQGLRQARAMRVLPTLVAGQLARRAIVVTPEVSLAEALRRAHESGVRAVVLASDPGPLLAHTPGVLPTAVMVGPMVDQVPLARRPWTAVQEVSRRTVDGLVLPASLGGEDLFEAMARTPATEYLVVDSGVFLGVLAAVDVGARLAPR